MLANEAKIDFLTKLIVGKKVASPNFLARLLWKSIWNIMDINFENQSFQEYYISYCLPIISDVVVTEWETARIDGDLCRGFDSR